VTNAGARTSGATVLPLPSPFRVAPGFTWAVGIAEILVIEMVSR
jgi:hypothetical protein